jgi:SAM-dependent methyltransferase
MSEAMHAEFDTVAGWTADAARTLGPDFAIPAGCRGSGGPATLGPLLHRLRVGADDRMLDIGAGVGGPAGFAQQVIGVRPVLAEPEAGACGAAVRLFGLPTVQADAARLPFADRSFDVVWSLGVLCTTPDHGRTLRELRRVLTDDGRAALLVYVAQGALPESPDGNNFPDDRSLAADLAAAGLTVVDDREMAGSDDEDAAWKQRSAAVDEELERQHGANEAWQQAEQQAAIMGRLISGRHVIGRVLTLGVAP